MWNFKTNFKYFFKVQIEYNRAEPSFSLNTHTHTHTHTLNHTSSQDPLRKVFRAVGKTLDFISYPHFANKEAES